MRRCFDTFGRDADVERAPDLYDGTHHLARDRGLHDREDKTLVDFHGVGRELGQADDRGVPGAEIIDLDAEADVAQELDPGPEQI